MTRYVLRYTGVGPVPAADVSQVRTRARVVDTDGRMLLVEAPNARITALVRSLPGWVATPETVVPLAPARPRVRPPRRASA